ncbi:DUF1934 domain-containing protein [Aureibacillus halotolerans]|nr:DUF1934 domain-containing protein [Aureibacillus halotolerans]
MASHAVKVLMDTMIKSDGEQETIHVEAKGIRRRTNNGLFLVFYEEGEDEERTQNVVRFEVDKNPPELKVVRSGGRSMRQVYREGETTEGQYEVPWGQWITKATTESVSFQDQDGINASLVFRYQFDIGGATAFHHTTIKIMEDTI